MNKCKKIAPDIRELNLYWFVKELRTYGYAKTTIHNACLVLEELLVNIINYSETKEPIILNLIYTADEINIRLADKGIKFNPLVDYTVDLNSSIEEKRIGGLGIHLVKNIAKSIYYKRIGRFNIIALSLCADSSALEASNITASTVSSTISFIQNNNYATA